MNEMKPISNSHNNIYKIAIILLLAYAAYSSAMKDLSRLQEVAGNVQAMTSEGLGGLAKVYGATRSLAEDPQLARGPEANQLSGTPRVEILATGGSVELAGFQNESGSSSVRREFSDNSSRVTTLANVRSKHTCDKQKEKQKTFDTWSVVAQLPKRTELLRHSVAVEPGVELDRLASRRARVRAIINRIPAEAEKADWPSISEFKTLNEAIGRGVTMKHSLESELKSRSVETSETAPQYFFEKVMRLAESETDNSETNDE